MFGYRDRDWETRAGMPSAQAWMTWQSKVGPLLMVGVLGRLARSFTDVDARTASFRTVKEWGVRC